MTKRTWTGEKLEQRTQYKNKARWIVSLSWIMLSGIFFYLCYFTVNSLGLYIILSLITFVIHVGVGFALKGPKLLVRNAVFYPFGIIVAQILNEISSKWNYTNETTIIGFALSNWIISALFYSVSSISAFILLRLFIGYETILPNPITSYSYRVKSAEQNPIELLTDYIKLFQNVALKTLKKKEQTWLKFEITPNSYAIAFTPKNETDTEVNIFTYRMQSDTVCKANKEEADVIVSMVDAIFTTRNKQGYTDEWQIENAPKHSEELKEALLEEHITRVKIPLKIPSLQQVRYDFIDLLKKNKKQITMIIVTAIISPLIIHFITSIFPS